jgi:hypothetical protein
LDSLVGAVFIGGNLEVTLNELRFGFGNWEEIGDFVPTAKPK